MILDDIIAEMERHLDLHPDDWSARLIYADALEDVGEEKRAEFQRVLVKRKKHPTRRINNKDNLMWDWWEVSECLHSNLGNVFFRMSLGIYHIRAHYPTRREAEDDLMWVWLEGHWPEEVDS